MAAATASASQACANLYGLVDNVCQQAATAMASASLVCVDFQGRVDSAFQ